MVRVRVRVRIRVRVRVRVRARARVRVRVRQHEALLPLLVQLPLVDLLLHCVARDEPVHLDVVPLAYAVRAVLRLHVAARVPVGVEDEDGGGAHQVEAEAARLRGEG